MKKSRFSDSQIMAILKQAENGVPVPELCREHGMSNASFYKWRAKFGGMDTSMIKRMKELEDENRRLKKMYAEERLAYSGEREHSFRLNVNTFSLNALPTEVCTPGVHVQSIS